jgi:hypothetical protein
VATAVRIVLVAHAPIHAVVAQAAQADHAAASVQAHVQHVATNKT